ncbi:hypothetical protein Mfer_0625 [Methanothermus fervidus DSM 2088]|uniref:NADH-quinone oxidoreductase subunit n=1 Tax=Methanothermus fervidus (strain ATCC 43054 / DSM 2088 / JCM 10308 / V24 S) TaxID=523846 RepID=E3GYP2_METFV|nr:hypothetical protein [Methanothermus fervidus]ADP77424.1 hypothetical protein Mfer_0625 [Methanothermus fervidus DSM 2088]
MSTVDYIFGGLTVVVIITCSYWLSGMLSSKSKHQKIFKRPFTSGAVNLPKHYKYITKIVVFLSFFFTLESLLIASIFTGLSFSTLIYFTLTLIAVVLFTMLFSRGE